MLGVNIRYQVRVYFLDLLRCRYEETHEMLILENLEYSVTKSLLL